MTNMFRTSFFWRRREMFRDEDPSRGFSVVSTECLDINSHTHEIGHNFGCDHPRLTLPDSARTPYSHAFRHCGAAAGENR